MKRQSRYSLAKRYAVENEAKTGPPEDRLRLRQKRSKPIVQRIHDWALSTDTLPQSSLGKAIAYLGGIWNGLRLFLDDPNVEIDNNGTERALRGIAGRTTAGRARDAAPRSPPSSTA